MDERIGISVKEAAKLLGVSAPKAYELARMADFPAVKVGGRTIVNRLRLQAWLDKQTNFTRSGGGCNG